MNENDGLPKYLCENCTSTLTEFYNFSIIYEQNVAQLKASLEQKENCQHHKDKIREDVQDELSINGTKKFNLETIPVTSNLSVVLENDPNLYRNLSGRVHLTDEDDALAYVKAEDIQKNSEEVVKSCEDYGWCYFDI